MVKEKLISEYRRRNESSGQEQKTQHQRSHRRIRRVSVPFARKRGTKIKIAENTDDGRNQRTRRNRANQRQTRSSVTKSADFYSQYPNAAVQRINGSSNLAPHVMLPATKVFSNHSVMQALTSPLQTVTAQDVLCAPQLDVNLLSLKKLIDAGHTDVCARTCAGPCRQHR